MKSKNFFPVVLAILDGWGVGNTCDSNAICLNNLPNFERFLAVYPNTQLCSSGACVGLRKGHSGNSEAGHLNIGAGRIVESDEVLIDKAINNKTFFRNP